MMEEKIAKFIQFTLLPGWGVVSQNRLLRMCGSIESCYEKDLTDLLQLDEKRKGGRIGEAKLRTFAENRCAQRNRLIAALSDELYVIGAGRRSGTESTVESGEKYGRVINRI